MNSIIGYPGVAAADPDLSVKRVRDIVGRDSVSAKGRAGRTERAVRRGRLDPVLMRMGNGVVLDQVVMTRSARSGALAGNSHVQTIGTINRVIADRITGHGPGVAVIQVGTENGEF